MTGLRRKSRALLSALPLVLWAIIACLLAFGHGPKPGIVPGLILSLVSVVVVIATVDLLNADHLRTLRRRYPGAEIFRIVAYPELLTQTGALVRSGLATSSHLRSGRYLSFLLSDGAVIIMGGLINPVERFKISTATVVALRSSRAGQGKFNLPVVELEFEVGGSHQRLAICPIQTRFGLPLAARAGLVERLALQLQDFLPPSRR